MPPQPDADGDLALEATTLEDPDRVSAMVVVSHWTSPMIGGLVTAVLGLLLGGAVLAGAAALVNEAATGELREQPPS